MLANLMLSITAYGTTLPSPPCLALLARMMIITGRMSGNISQAKRVPQPVSICIAFAWYIYLTLLYVLAALDDGRLQLAWCGRCIQYWSLQEGVLWAAQQQYSATGSSTEL